MHLFMLFWILIGKYRECGTIYFFLNFLKNILFQQRKMNKKKLISSDIIKFKYYFVQAIPPPSRLNPLILSGTIANTSDQVNSPVDGMCQVLSQVKPHQCHTNQWDFLKCTFSNINSGCIRQKITPLFPGGCSLKIFPCQDLI